MNATFEPRRAQAVRDLLVTVATPRRARRRRTLTAALVLGGAVGGAALSTAAFAATGQLSAATGTPSGAPTPALTGAVSAPAGVTPGSPVVVLLGDAAAVTLTTSTTFSLADRPSDATHVRATVTPATGGSLAWGTDAGGNNPHGTWRADEVGPRHSSSYDFALDATTDTLYLSPRSGFTGAVSIQYITQIPTHLGVNANGETYGVEGGPDGQPDLVAVWAEASGGIMVQGYVRSTDLYAFSPDHPGQPANPRQAGQWQDERAENYPNGWDIPAFGADGTTVVGTFHVG